MMVGRSGTRGCVIATRRWAGTSEPKGTRMGQTESESKARDGYDQMAEVYANHVALEMTVPSLVRSVLQLFAHQVQQQGPGKVVDAGCGPGHVTAFLAGLGLDVFGVDNSPALLEIARASHPDIRFEPGRLG